MRIASESVIQSHQLRTSETRKIEIVTDSILLNQDAKLGWHERSTCEEKECDLSEVDWKEMKIYGSVDYVVIGNVSG